MTEEAKEKMRAYHKAYHEAHKEEHKAYMRAWYAAHKEEQYAYRIKCYCSNPEDIENYELAKADNFVNWDVHHRLETHTSDGERRLIDLSKEELIALGTYYGRPAAELIFMKHGDHMSLHRLNQQCSEETRAKMSESWKHRAPVSAETRAKMSESWKHRAPVSAETRAKMSESQKGRPVSAETRAKMSESAKRRWSKSAKNTN